MNSGSCSQISSSCNCPIKRATNVFIQRFFNYKTIVSRRQPYFTPVRTKATISFETLTNVPSQFEEKIFMLFWEGVNMENCAAGHVHSQGLCYLNDLWTSDARPLPDLTTISSSLDLSSWFLPW